MDNLTHTLVGVTLVRAGLGGRVAGATPVIVLASNIPDADIVTALSGSVAYLAAHRGPTHGPLGVLLLAVLSAALVMGVRALRSTARRGAPVSYADDRGAPASLAAFWPLFGVACAGTGLHVLMDLPTSYGTRVLSPFDETWFAFDWVPIIDIYIWGVLALGFAVSWRRPAARRAVARAVLVALLCFYGVRAGAHAQALSLAAATTADGTAAPCATAPILTRHPMVIEAADAGPGRCLQAAALPTFFSPLNWRLIRQQSDGYEMREVRLGQAELVAERVFVPSEADRWVALARGSDTARVFLRFSRFPASRSALLPDGAHRVRFLDVRFVGPPPRRLERDPRASAPFLVTVELTAAGAIRAERLGN